MLFKTFMTNNNNVNNSSGFSRRSVFDTVPVINNEGFSVSSTYITVPEAGVYLVGVSCFYDTNSNGNRDAPAFSVEINNSRQGEIASSAYMRDNEHDKASSNLNCLYQLVPGDQISLTFRRDGSGSNTVTLQGSNSSIYLYKID